MSRMSWRGYPSCRSEGVRVEQNLVYVPIRIPVCKTCGERYYDRRTIRFLEEVDQRLKEGKAILQEVGKVLELSS